MANLDRFGLMLEPQEGMSTAELMRWAGFAERSGYGYVFRSDHLLPTSGRRGVDSPECWVTLAAIAAKTKRIKFGPMVSPIGFRNPALLARMACTVHSISRGRLQLSLGAGWYRDEYYANGMEFPKFAVRRKQLEEALEIIVPLIRGKRVDFDGRFFSAHTDCLPKPGKRIHLIIGGRSVGTVKIASKIGDEWNVFGPTKTTFAAMKRISDASKRRLVVSQMGPFLVGKDRRDLNSKLKRWMNRRGLTGNADEHLKRLRQSGAIVGTPAEFVSEVQDRLNWGIERFYLQIADPVAKGSVGLLTETLRGV